MGRLLSVLLLLTAWLSHGAAAGYVAHPHPTRIGIVQHGHSLAQATASVDAKDATAVDHDGKTPPARTHAYVPAHGVPSADFAIAEPVIERQRQPLPRDAALASARIPPPVEPPSA
jgi:hypothetical protein